MELIMSSKARGILAFTTIVVLSLAVITIVVRGASSTFTAPLTISPGETLEVGGDQPGSFALTTLNEGETNVVVTADNSDFVSPVTLGPRGESTRRVASNGSVVLTNTSDQDTAQLKVTIVSYRPQTIDIRHRPTQ